MSSSASTSASPPFPASGTYISSIHESCRKVREASGIQISEDGMSAFLARLSESDFDRLCTQHGLALPLRFPSLVSEINFLGVLSLLNMLSAYRVPLHKATGQGAYQNILKLLLGLYITGPEDALSAQGLRALSASRVAEILGVSLHQETHKGPITIGVRGGDMNEAVQLVVKLCNEAGERLQAAGYDSLGALALQILREAERLPEPKGADHFLEQITRAIPGFADMATVDGEPVYLFKKACFFLQALAQRVPADQLRVPDPKALPMFVDNVIPTMLVRLRILDLSHANAHALRSWADQVLAAHEGEGVHLTRQEAYTVRAAALDAGRCVVHTARASDSWAKKMTEADLDGYLWSVAKDDPTLRKVPRMVERNTVMY